MLANLSYMSKGPRLSWSALSRQPSSLVVVRCKGIQKRPARTVAVAGQGGQRGHDGDREQPDDSRD